MSFPFQINILELILKGILIGILASAPMGPVGILCIKSYPQETRRLVMLFVYRALGAEPGDRRNLIYARFSQVWEWFCYGINR